MGGSRRRLPPASRNRIAPKVEPYLTNKILATDISGPNGSRRPDPRSFSVTRPFTQPPSFAYIGLSVAIAALTGCLGPASETITGETLPPAAPAFDLLCNELTSPTPTAGRCERWFDQPGVHLHDPVIAMHPFNPDVLALAAIASSVDGVEVMGFHYNSMRVWATYDGGRNWEGSSVSVPRTPGGLDALNVGRVWIPDIAFDERGVLHAVATLSYQSNRSYFSDIPVVIDARDVFYVRLDGGTWTEPAFLTQDGQSNQWPRIVATPGGLIVTLHSLDRGLGAVARSPDGAEWRVEWLEEERCAYPSKPLLQGGVVVFVCQGPFDNGDTSVRLMQAHDDSTREVYRLPTSLGWNPRLAAGPDGAWIVAHAVPDDLWLWMIPPSMQSNSSRVALREAAQLGDERLLYAPIIGGNRTHLQVDWQQVHPAQSSGGAKMSQHSAILGLPSFQILLSREPYILEMYGTGKDSYVPDPTLADTPEGSIVVTSDFALSAWPASSGIRHFGIRWS